MPNLKELTLGFVTLIVSVASFWLWFRAVPELINGEFHSIGLVALPPLGLGASAALFSLSMIFIKSSRLAYVTAFVSMLIPYFFLPATFYVILSLGATLLLTFSAAYRIRTEYMLSLGFHLTKILKSGLPVYLTASSLLIATFFFAGLNEDLALGVLLPRPAMQAALPLIINFVIQPSGDAPKINPDATIREVLSLVIKNGLEQQGAASAKISAKELDAAVSMQITEFEKQFELKLSGKEKISDVFYGLITKQILTLAGPYRKYLPHVSALTFFLAFKVITIPLYYIVMAGLLVLIKISVALKILKSEIVEMKVERLTL